MTVEITYSKSAITFIKKNSAIITKEASDHLLICAIKKLLKLSVESVDVKSLKGEEGVYRIRKGKIRTVFRYDANGNIIVISVHKIDFRGNVYE